MSGDHEIPWNDLLGGYRVPYDPRPALDRLRGGPSDAAWAELWNGLHHQGAVDSASYTAVPALVAIYQTKVAPDWNAHALIGTIELQRGADNNPDIPSWLATEYSAALRELTQRAYEDLKKTRDPLVARSALAVVAIAKNLRTYARLLLELDESEAAEVLAAHPREGA
jgi:hypothetical protein